MGRLRDLLDIFAVTFGSPSTYARTYYIYTYDIFDRDARRDELVVGTAALIKDTSMTNGIASIGRSVYSGPNRGTGQNGTGISEM